MTRTSEDLALTGRQRLVLIVLLGAQFMFALDFSIVTVALPVIGEDLGIPDADLQWIVTAFALTAASLVLVMGRVADLHGRKRMFLIGMVVLTVASAVGGFATEPWVLFAARAGQGLATAITMPAALSLLTTSFEEGPLRNRALGLNGALLSLGFAVGAVLGGVVTDVLGWRSTFLINVPAGLLILVAAPFLLTDGGERKQQKLDVPGAALLSTGLLALVLGISTGERSGWGSPAFLGLVALSVAAFVSFWFVESRSSHPLAAVSILRRPTVSWGNLAGFTTFAMESSKVFLLTLYLQRVLEASALATGLAFGVLGAGAFTGGLVAARIIDRLGAKATLLLGLTLQGVTTLTFLLLGVGETLGFAHILLATAVGGFGHVLVIVAYTVTVTSGLPDSEQGLATGLAGQTQQIAFTVGTPLISAVAIAFATGRFDDPTSSEAVLGGVHAGLLVNAVLILATAVLILVFLPAERRPGGGRSATDLADAGAGRADRPVPHGRS